MIVAITRTNFYALTRQITKVTPKWHFSGSAARNRWWKKTRRGKFRWTKAILIPLFFYNWYRLIHAWKWVCRKFQVILGQRTPPTIDFTHFFYFLTTLEVSVVGLCAKIIVYFYFYGFSSLGLRPLSLGSSFGLRPLSLGSRSAFRPLSRNTSRAKRMK